MERQLIRLRPIRLVVCGIPPCGVVESGCPTMYRVPSGCLSESLFPVSTARYYLLVRLCMISGPSRIFYYSPLLRAPSAVFGSSIATARLGRVFVSLRLASFRILFAFDAPGLVAPFVCSCPPVVCTWGATLLL